MARRVREWERGCGARGCGDSLLVPWGAPNSSTPALVVTDFTPNYMCDHEAIPAIHSAATRPRNVRLLVVMRDPLGRAVSEWRMFGQRWLWDPMTNWSKAAAHHVRRLRACNGTLFRNTSLLASLPTAELTAYLKACFGRGGATMYLTSSLYSVCLLHALRFFGREQFLFLRYEDLKTLGTEALLRVVARFAGLHIDDELIRAASASKRCELSSAPASSSHELRERDPITPFLQSFFAPYNRLLAKLIHPSFGW